MMNQWIASLILSAAMAVPAGPVFPPRTSAREVPELLETTAFVRGLDDASLVALVPVQSGLCFVGCPNCVEERMEEQLDWSPGRPDEIRCRFCKHRYPSEKYPMDRTLVVRNARGEVQRYPYWENAKGYRYYFGARRDDQVRVYLAEKAQQLTMLYAATGEREHARRAALLLDRFAQVFPGWCYHFDYPFRQKEIHEGIVPPSGLRRNYRTARWTWWAYKDIPEPLVLAYDGIRGADVFPALSREAGVDVAKRIERDLFRNAAEGVLANPEDYTNMSPAAWRMLVTVGRVIGEPRYVHEVVRRVRRFTETRFFYDGSWYEGSPDYSSQAVGWLAKVFHVLNGYSDPPGYRDEHDGARFDGLDLESEIPRLGQIRRALEKLRLPDGRSVPVHDTWHSSREKGSAVTEPYLLPALGHACLGGGFGPEQTQFHLTWSGGYGHDHADNLSLMLFAHGREVLSDLGYTHTRDRAWTLATAAHNTVVIDGENQAVGKRQAPPTDGGLRFFDAADRRVQVVGAEGTRGYPAVAGTYQRTLIVIDAGGGRRYAVDVFEVRGGRRHDYFFHGDADEAASVTTPRSSEPCGSLLPAGFSWKPTRNEGEKNRTQEVHYAYGFLRNLKRAEAPPGIPLPVTFRRADSPSPALRITFIPEPDSRLFLGENPAVRGADEDDARLDRFTRPFAMLRHEAEGRGGRSVFASVIEPYADSPFITRVERIAADEAPLALRVHIGDRTDVVVYGADKRVTLDAGPKPATFAGLVGVLSARGEAVEHAYALGEGGWERGDFSLRSRGSQTLPLKTVGGNALVLEGHREPPPLAGDVVRLLTDDGWVYPYTVVAAKSEGNLLRVHVAEWPGLSYDPTLRELRLSAFPQRRHAGAVRAEWMSRGSRAP